MTELLTLDGFDDAVTGVATVWDSSGHRVDRVIYDGKRVMDSLIEDGLSPEEAMEYIEFNIEGAYAGPATPIVCWPMTMGELAEMESLQ